LQLPLFAAPLDPAALLASEAAGGTTGGGNSTGMQTLPPYRYRVMSDKAREATVLLSGFGQQLLQALENQEARHKELLGQSQLADLWSFTQQAQQQAVDIANNTLDTLNTSLAAAQQRHDHYQELVNAGQSALESAALNQMSAAATSFGVAGGLTLAAGCLELIPTIFGFADGGFNPGGAVAGAAGIAQAAAFTQGAIAESQNTQAGFERRAAEWQQQVTQAAADITTLQSQIKGQKLQIAAAKTAQSLATQKHGQVMEMYAWLSGRFTGEALYQWLTGQLSALYYQAYDATLSLCRSAQACWQYELADFVTTFIPAAAWNDHYRGLLAGETLRLSLQQMDSAWLARNTRALNITRSVSLREKLGKDGWDKLLTALQDKGGNGGTFQLTEQDFDADYPGHYLRRIASVSVSLPAAVGPYQNVRATLTQTGSSLVLKADKDAVQYLKDGKGSDASIKRNLNASQQVALSGGLDDSGVFTLHAGDERYLPFEGTGAVSDWALAFPNPDSAEQQQVLNSLQDIVVTVHYTARNGGNAFAKQVQDIWKPES
jgi:hypothetical protein